MSKSHLVPQGTISIPRLELMAAVLAVKLVEAVETSFLWACVPQCYGQTRLSCFRAYVMIKKNSREGARGEAIFS